MAKYSVGLIGLAVMGKNRLSIRSWIFGSGI